MTSTLREVSQTSSGNYGSINSEPIEEAPNSSNVVAVAAPLLNRQQEVTPGSENILQRFISTLQNPTPKQMTAIGLIGALFFFAICGTGIYIATVQNAPPAFLQNATVVCALVPHIGAPYLNATKLPVIQAIATNITGLVNQFCNGAPITNASVITAGQTALTALRNSLANETAFAVTGQYMSENADWNPVMCWDLILNGPTADEGSDVIRDWVQTYTFGWMSLTTMREGAFASLQNLCGYMSGLVPQFNGTSYSCTSLTGIVSPLIKKFVSLRNVWPR